MLTDLLIYLHKEFHCWNISFAEQPTALVSPSGLQSFFWHESFGNCQMLSNTFFGCTSSHTSLHSATTWPLFKKKKTFYCGCHKLLWTLSSNEVVKILNACACPTTFRILISVMSKLRDKSQLCFYEMVKFRIWATYIYLPNTCTERVTLSVRKLLYPHLYPQLLSLVNTCHIMKDGNNTCINVDFVTLEFMFLKAAKIIQVPSR